MATLTVKANRVGLVSKYEKSQKKKQDADVMPRSMARSIVNLSKLPKAVDIVANLKEAHKKMRYYTYDGKGNDISQKEKLNLEWDNHRQTYYGTFEGRRLPLGQTCVQTALKFAKIPDGDWLIGKPPQRLVETLNDQIAKEQGVQIAVNDEEIRAIVAPGFVFMTDYELVHGATQALKHLDPQGIEVVDHPDTDAKEYRMIFGNSIVKKDEVRMMLTLAASEFGLASSVAFLGLWRVSCLNGMLSCEKSHVARWDHRGTKGTFVNKMSGVLEAASSFGAKMRILLDKAMNTRLSIDGDFIVMAMHEMEVIKPRQYDVLSSAVGGGIYETSYDLWNLMTHSAKSLEMKPRHAMEKAAAKYLTAIDSVNERALKISAGPS